MDDARNPAAPQTPDEQRKALEDAERRANAPQPDNFRDEAMQDKQVEIPQPGSTERPIQGLDP